ncbi:hypothetical protein TRV_02092 [Trichophyton verrucosum HKI 0517]|uniref:Uncharacterized protein n=1 Tax=Trichophyton verrucosum (strain HKI 0517) TaxID=663202 RepID=D4D4S5_TRIVH|nr:uncharacterized protein TRV_02092 [Trichophyton verrucosum HKI 0517]EFE43149.1 hypothetical protein TRV_02092 [Trichophyton verrucosum HKI 0517]
MNHKSSICIGISFGNQACNRITYNDFHTSRPALRPPLAAWTEIGLDRRTDLVRLLDDQLWCRGWSHPNGTAAYQAAGDWSLTYEQGQEKKLVSRDETKASARAWLKGVALKLGGCILVEQADISPAKGANSVERRGVSTGHHAPGVATRTKPAPSGCL